MENIRSKGSVRKIFRRGSKRILKSKKAIYSNERYSRGPFRRAKARDSYGSTTSSKVRLFLGDPPLSQAFMTDSSPRQSPGLLDSEPGRLHSFREKQSPYHDRGPTQDPLRRRHQHQGHQGTLTLLLTSKISPFLSWIGTQPPSNF